MFLSIKLLPQVFTVYIFLAFTLASFPQTVLSDDSSIETLESQIEQQPEAFEILKKLGTAYLKATRNQDAIKILKKAKEINPEDGDVRWKLALAYSRVKKKELSIEEARKSIQLNPNQFQPHIVLADNLYSLKQDEQALKEYQLALSLNPEYINAYRRIGYIHYDSKKYKEAVDAFTSYLQKFQKDTEAQFQLGMALYSLKKYEEAILEYKKALEINPNAQEARLWLGISYSSVSKFKEAIDEFEIYTSSNAENAFAYFEYAKTLSLDKNYDEALKKVRTAINIKPNDVGFRGLLSQIYGKMDKSADQIKELKSILDDNPGHPYIHRTLAIAYDANSQHELAIKEFKEHLESSNSDVYAYYRLALVFNRLNKIPEAIEAFKASVKIDPAYQASYHELGVIYAGKLGKYEDAINQFRKSIQVKDNAYSRTYLSYIYAHRLGNIQEAFKEGLLALKIDPEEEWAHFHLAGLYQQIGNFKSALIHKKKSANLRKGRSGHQHPYAEALIGVAYTLDLMGNTEQANYNYQKAIKTGESFRHKNFNGYVKVLLSVSDQLALRGEIGFREGLKLLEKAKTLIKSTADVETSILAQVDSKLGSAYLRKGKLDKAEGLLKDAYEKQKKLGLLAELQQTLTGLSLLYSNTRVNDKWINVLKENAEITRKLYGENNLTYAYNLADLASAQIESGEGKAAKLNAAKCLKLARTLAHTESSTYLYCLTVSGGAELALGNYAEAETYYKRVVRSKTSPESTQLKYVGNLALGVLYANQKKFKLAENHIRLAAERLENTFLSNLPAYSEVIGNLAWVLLMQEKMDEAWILAERAASHYVDYVDRVFSYTSEKDKINFLQAADIDFYATVAMKKIAESQIRKKLYLRILQYKNNILDHLISQSELRAVSADPAINEVFIKLTAKRQALSNLKIKLSDKYIDPDIYSGLRKEIEDLESRLSRAYSKISTTKKLADLNVDRIYEALPKKSTLVEFLKINPYRFSDQSNTDHYMAIVLNSGEEPKFEILGEAKSIDETLASLKRSIQEMHNETTIKKKSNELYKMIFKPLEGHLSPHKLMFIAPDSNLNLLPFNILVDDTGKYLIESYLISYLNSGKDLVKIFNNQNSTKKDTVVLFGNPSYDLPENIISIPITSSDLFLPQVRSADSDDLHFNSLPATQIEIDGIKSILNMDSVVTFSGENASEKNLKNISSPNILHLATHGFFLEDQISRSKDQSKKDGNFLFGLGINGVGGRLSNQKSFANLENPLLRSGLAFSIANDSAKNLQETGEDGLLVALEVASLNLVETNLVILSACNTGVGEVPRGQGVVGLRRAFQEAGAKSIMMSLWQVPDKETKDLMVQFYKKLYDGKSKIESIHEASLDVMRAVKAEKGTTHPFFWGGFVLLGDPGIN